MNIITSAKEMNRISRLEQLKQRSIGFVPTMGSLHSGHVSLIERAQKENDTVVVSVFVNPTQFGENEDFDSYPRDFYTDQKLCEGFADHIFYPEVSDMYGAHDHTRITVDTITETLCGARRPGHFQGVTTIVAKLFNIVQPDNAYFGLKDYQQYVVIKRMTEDLFMNINICGCDIIREINGVAKSSRNQYLTQEELDNASIIYTMLKHTREKIIAKETDLEQLKKYACEQITAAGGKVDYFEIVDAHTLGSVKDLNNVVIAAAVFFGRARLIDNILV
jgi:pantoate--beta-alanine ligase